MAFDVGAAIAHIKLDLDDFKKGIEQAKDHGNSLVSGFSKVGGAISEVSKQSAVLAGVVGGALVLGIKSSVDAWREAEDVQSQQVAVLKSTHGAAGLYLEDLQDQASALQKVTTFGDEAIASGQNLLLTFTNIKGPVFQKATETILDMSQALGQDLKSSAIQLGKALNDPIQGVTALRRVGVSFTEDQLKQIEVLQKSGKVMEAQELILKELSTEFGGSATAAGKTFTGQMEILKNQLGELQEGLGRVLVTAIVPLVTAINNFVQDTGFIDWFDSVLTKFEAFITAWQDWDPIALREVLSEDQIALLSKLGDAFNLISDWIKNNQELVITFLKGLGIALGALVILGTITALLMAFTNPLVLAALAIAALYTAWQTNFLGIRDITTAVWNFLSDLFINYVMPVISMLVAFITENWTNIMLMTQGIFEVITGIIQMAWAVIVTIIKVALALITGDFGKAWQAIKEGIDMFFGGFTKVLVGVIDYIRGWGGMLIHNLVQPFEDAWNRISEFLGKIRDALDFTKRHSPSVVDIVKRGVGQVNDALGNLDLNANISPTQVAGVAAVGGGMNNISLNIDMSNALIGDAFDAQMIGQKVGNAIIKELQQNVRF